MSARRISQRQARATAHELAHLKETNRLNLARWSSNYPSGTHIETLQLSDVSTAKLSTAQSLGFVVVVKMDGMRMLAYAVKP